MGQADDRQKVIELCKGWIQELPAPLGRAVLQNLRSSIRLVPPEKAESHHPLGATHIGGAPDLPEEMEWPTFRGFAGKPNEDKWAPYIGTPLPFVAQVNLAEVSPADGEGVLPKTGMLYFFLLDVNEAFGRYAEYGEVSRTIHAATTFSSMHRVDPPDALPIKLRYNSVRVVPRLEWTLPNPYDLISKQMSQQVIDAHIRFWDHGDELREQQGFGPYYQPRHRLLGHPNLIQTFRLEPDVRLLFQVDSDCILSSYPKTGMQWGDAGRAYFLIEASELAAGHLDRAYAYLECS